MFQDISKLTCTKEYVFDYLTDISISDICQCVLEAKNTNDDVEIDIGIGTLFIAIIDDELSFNFVPSEALQEELLDTLDSNESKLQKKLETRITAKMIKLYKELI